MALRTYCPSCLYRWEGAIRFLSSLVVRSLCFIFLAVAPRQENTEVLDYVRRTSKAPYDGMEKTPNSVTVTALAKRSGSTSGCGRKRKTKMTMMLVTHSLKAQNV
jgi:hypothetical protein